MKSNFTLLFIFFSIILFSQRPFITKWNTNANNDDSKQLAIGLIGDYNYSFFNFQDSAINGNGNGSGTLILNLPIKGIYIISVTPSSNLGFKAAANSNLEANKLIDVVQWGDIQWNSNLSEMFKSCKNITTFSASDIPNLSTVNDLSYMFSGAENFNHPITNWNVSTIKNMKGIFNGASSFNQSLMYWDTNNVTDMSEMFQKATSFNQPIGNWKTLNVTNMSAMFNEAKNFNQPLYWNTNKVTDMSYMFNNATKFNQDLGRFSIVSLRNLAFMIDNVGLDCENYSLTLKKWATSNSPKNLMTRASNLVYNSDGKLYRDILINNKNWEIGGDIYAPSCSSTLNTEDLQRQIKLNIFPNPANDLVTVQSSEDVKSILIYSTDGKLLSEVKNQKTFNLSKYPTGSYLVKVIFAKGEIFSKQIVKK